MVVLGLLLVALVCLILGLILTSAWFLVGSLAASLVAGLVLWRQRGQGAARSDAKDGAAAGTPAAPARQTTLVTGTAFAGKTTPAAPPTEAADDDVWVVDGQPLFHAKECEQLVGQESEPVPYAQAVDDGFTECSTCKPRTSVRVTEVWVVDGRPEYHLKDCAHLTGEPDQIPRPQAIEDGFTPCPDCRPDGPAPADSPGEPAASVRVSALPDGVWVVDGRPRYHLADCLIIKDQDAEEIPLAQATEDGFIPCTMCEPNVTRV